MESESEPDDQPEAETSAPSPCQRLAAQNRASAESEDPRLSGEAYTAMPRFAGRSLWKVVAAAALAAALGIAGLTHHGGAGRSTSSPAPSSAGQLGQ